MLTDNLHDSDIEYAVLAAVLSDNGVLNGALGALSSEHFYSPEIREHFAAAQDLYRDGRAVNMVTLRGLTASDPLGGSNVAERLKAVSFNEALPRPRDMADALIDLAQRRTLKALADQVGEAVLNRSTLPAQVAAMIMRECDRLLSSSQPAGQTYWTPPDAMNEALNRLDRDDGETRLLTGLTDLDRMTGGLHRRRIVYLAARTSMGKSALGVKIAENVAKAGHAVLYVSLEMNLEEIEARIASAATYRANPIAYDRALNRQLTNTERERFREAALSQELLPLAIEERPGLSVAEIAARVRTARQEFASKGQSLGLVVVDHIGKIRHRDPRTPMVQQLGQTSNELAALAKAEDVVMLALHQLNRGPEQRDNKRPMLADLRDSGNLEQDADSVWLLFRPAYYLMRGSDGEDAAAALNRQNELEKKQNILEVIVAKNRNGAVGTVDAYCDLAFNIIDNADQRATT